MGVIFGTSEIITLERNDHTADEIVRGREDEPFGIRVITAVE